MAKEIAKMLKINTSFEEAMTRGGEEGILSN